MIINFGKNHIKKELLSFLQLSFDNAVDELNIPCQDLEVNVDFVSRRKIKKINSKFRGVNKVTDVLSFPFLLKEGVTGEQLIQDVLTKENFPNDINYETGNIVLGDIYICFSKVKAQSKEYNTTIKREFTYLAVHGLLHLLGYDHEKEDDKKHMREVEEKIMHIVDLFRYIGLMYHEP